MRIIVALAVYGAALLTYLGVGPDAGHVSPHAWALVGVLGAMAVVALNVGSHRSPSVGASALWVINCLLIAAVLVGADEALRILGNSVKPRRPSSPALGGLELHHLFLPGGTSVALGCFAVALADRLGAHGWRRSGKKTSAALSRETGEA